MQFKTLDITIQDLPTTVKIEFPSDGFTDLSAISSSLTAQILHNSRYDIEEDTDPRIEIQEIDRQGNVATLEIKKIS